MRWLSGGRRRRRRRGQPREAPREPPQPAQPPQEPPQLAPQSRPPATPAPSAPPPPWARESAELLLPTGREEARDYDGRVFYIDHNTRQTSWIDPRDRYLLNTCYVPPIAHATAQKRNSPAFKSMHARDQINQ
uniref:Probable E3 ubiquitin-protein ligase hulA n=1 Tax=Tursiops truncatus TaxID=9739 RepID=A0A6J3QUQ5_TURTR|nr:probable E3 ubiquitin-protein ligase hulA [Tursiops truncatus]